MRVAITFNPNGDYKTQFQEAVEELIHTDIPDRTERIKAVNHLCERYIHEIHQRPDSYQLHKLTDYLLRDELNIVGRSKTKKTGMLSNAQQERFKKTETDIQTFENVIGSDGRFKGAKQRTTTEKEF